MTTRHNNYKIENTQDTFTLKNVQMHELLSSTHLQDGSIIQGVLGGQSQRHIACLQVVPGGEAHLGLVTGLVEHTRLAVGNVSPVQRKKGTCKECTHKHT